MASRTIVTVSDDIDNSEGASTIAFAYRGSNYEIDLSEKNQAAFDKAIAKYVGAAGRSDMVLQLLRPDAQLRLVSAERTSARSERGPVKMASRCQTVGGYPAKYSERTTPPTEPVAAIRHSGIS